MRKRIGALGLSAVLLLAMICPALAAGTTFVVKGPDQAPRKGETFTVTVELENNPGFNAIGMCMTYDSEKVTCTEATEGELLGEMISDTNPSAPRGAVIGAVSLDSNSGDGTVGRFVFTAESDLTGQEIVFNVESFCDEEGIDFPFTIDINGMMQSNTPSSADSTPVTEANSDSDSQSVPTHDPEPNVQNEPAPISAPETVLEPVQTQPVQEITFTDTKGHWGERFIASAAELGMFKGYPDGSFQPNLAVTRAQYVTVLYRMAGSPAVSAETPFTDIYNQSQEFRTAIAWGYENGYLNGKGEGVFDPSGPVTRQEAMKILFGYDGGVSGMEAMFTAIYDDYYSDSGELDAWGKSPMYWGVYHSLITGTSDTTLSPKGTATRAQLAKILTVYYDQQNKE